MSSEIEIPDVVLKNAQNWAKDNVFDQDTRKEIHALIETNNRKELVDRFYRDLEFGTGGLRGILGAGTSRMNIYNIRKASLAFSRYLKKFFGPTISLRVGITYDSRKFSREFALTSAEVFAAQGIECLITQELRPVPMLSFMVRQFDCHGGICITASHNPPNYNGYKVYWQTGGQVVPPHDESIIAEYGNITNYDIPRIEIEKAQTQKLVRFLGPELDDPYFAKIAGLSLLKQNPAKSFHVVFTPLHGSGLYPVTTALKNAGFLKVSVVPEQSEPNSQFPTVDYPNPEDPAALKMAVDLARKEKADLVLATDPDCDRVGIAYRDTRQEGEYTFLNGNQIGCLMTYFVLSQLKHQNRLPENALVIKTIVTTDLQSDIARGFGCHVDETLTGFKWICQRIEDYESGALKPYRKYVCGGEESYGFLMDSFVRDKDGVAACLIAAQMTAFYESQGLKLHDVLDQIFRKHGIYQESLRTLTMPGKEGADKIRAIMNSLRKSPPRDIGGIHVARVQDILTGSTTIFKTEGTPEYEKIDLPSSDVLQFILADGAKISVRPSGTEPKIKFYVSVKCEISADLEQKEFEQLKDDCAARVHLLERLFVQIAESLAPMV